MRSVPSNAFARLAALLLVFIAARMVAEEGSGFPANPVDVIVPFAAGGGSDVFARIIQNAIRKNELSPQPWVIRNAGGAGGTIGSRRVLDAQPDGHTILCLHDGIYTAKHYGIADWGPSDFEPIAATGQSESVVAVAENSPYRTLADLMQDARDRPYRVVCGTNLGAPSHYSALLLEEAFPGAKFRFTQSGGGSKRLAQIKGGHVDLTGFSVAEFVQFQSAGIRALAVLSEDRLADLPDLPTAREQGIDVVDSLMQFWWAPKETPADRIDFFVDALNAAMEDEEVRERLTQLHMEPVFLTGNGLKETIAERSERIESLVVEVPVGVAPLEWIVLGFVVLCGGWVWWEGRKGMAT